MENKAPINTYTVKQVIKEINSNNILLPSLQRKFVWTEEQIVNLFDSIMRGYPFGNFLFWEINDVKGHKYHFYKFIQDLSLKEKTINANAGVVINDTINVVMDGQQRLTALYIGINGSLTTKDKYKKDKPENWKTKHLYFKPHDEDRLVKFGCSYEFKFLDDKDAADKNLEKNNDEKYYRVSDFFACDKNALFEQCGFKRIKNLEKNEWKRNVEKLYNCLNEEGIIQIQTIGNKEIGDVLEIFKRINSGGTQLSPANLLFSTVITSWEEGRDKMDALIKMINTGGVVEMDENFLIRACLYLLDLPAVANIESLDPETVEKIKTKWEAISEAILKAKDFLEKHNIYDVAILSYNAILPIIYYYFHSNNIKQKDSEEQLFYFFAISQLFSLFGGSSDTTLAHIRGSMCHNEKLGYLIEPFELKNLYNINLSTSRTNAFRIGKKDIDNLVNTVKYGDKKSYTLLTLLQPNIILKDNKYDVDHVCSQYEFKKILKDVNEEDSKILKYKGNLISNLQLINYKENRQDKRGKSLYKWVVEEKNRIAYDPFSSEASEEYKIDTKEKFNKFYEARRELIVRYLCERLGVEK